MFKKSPPPMPPLPREANIPPPSDFAPRQYHPPHANDRDVIARSVAAFDAAQNEIAVLRAQYQELVEEHRRTTAEIARQALVVEQAHNEVVSALAIRDEALLEIERWRAWGSMFRKVFDSFDATQSQPAPRSKHDEGRIKELVGEALPKGASSPQPTNQRGDTQRDDLAPQGIPGAAG